MPRKRHGKSPPAPTRDSPPTAPQEKVVSVFIIPEFECTPPEYPVNFENKSTAGFHPRYFFPSGNIEDTDATPEAAAMRECEEETGIIIILQSADLIGKLQVADRMTGEPAYIYIYTKRIPSTTRTKPGSDQIEVLRLGAEDIENLITQRFLGLDHAKAWQIYKQTGSRRSRPAWRK